MRRALALAVSAVLVVVSALSGLQRPDPPPEPPPVPSVSYEVPDTVHVVPFTRDGYSSSLYHWPVMPSTPITDGFGPRPDGPPCAGCLADHKGVDFSRGIYGDPIYAVAPGVVVETGAPPAGYGFYAVIRSEINGDTFDAVYAHMPPGGRRVSVGQWVIGGEQIGVIGATGNATGPHLHLEIQVDGVQIDPLSWLIARV